MNRPDTRNSLSLDMIDRLHSRFTRLAVDRTVSAIVLAANGPVFCAGHDLKELTAHRADAGQRSRLLHRGDDALFRDDAGDRRLPQAGDRRRAGDGHRRRLPARRDLRSRRRRRARRKFCTPGVNIGLFCSTPMVALSRNVVAQARDGDAAARRDAAGRAMPPTTASSIASSPPAECSHEALALAGKIAAQVAAHRRHRQGRILRAGRDAARGCLRLRRRASWSRT